MFKMSTLIAGKFKEIVTERVASNRARTNRAIAKVRELNTKGKLNTPGLVRNHQIAADALSDARRWEAIARKVL